MISRPAITEYIIAKATMAKPTRARALAARSTLRPYSRLRISRGRRHRACNGFRIDGLQHRADRIGIALAEVARRPVGQVLQLIELDGGNRLQREVPFGEALQ